MDGLLGDFGLSLVICEKYPNDALTMPNESDPVSTTHVS